MLIFNEHNKPILIDSVYTPTISEYMWVLDLTMMDFTLAPITTFEQIICNSMMVRINNFEFIVPTMWNILVFDRDTSQIDVAEFKKTGGKEFTALVFGPTRSSPAAATITVIDYFIEHVNYVPSLTKQQLLCHPIGPNEWVNISPSDAFNKYLKGRVVGDLFN